MNDQILLWTTMDQNYWDSSIYATTHIQKGHASDSLFFFFLLSSFFYLFSLIFNTLSIIFIIFSLYLSSSSSSLSLYQIHSILTQTISLLLKYTYRRRIGFESTRDNALCIMYMIFKIKKRVTHDTALSMIRHLL